MPESFFEKHISPQMERFDAETMMNLVRGTLDVIENIPGSLHLLESMYSHQDPRLRTEMAGVHLKNPLVLAAGWTKDAKALKSLHALGIAGISVGSVLPFPQEGNPKPRLWFSTHNGVALNRMGFNSSGMEEVGKKLEQYGSIMLPIGISIGINKSTTPEIAPQRYAMVAMKMAKFADWLEINVSSPNTVGLRNLQHKEHITQIIASVREGLQNIGNNVPLFIKIAPDMEIEQLDEILETCEENRVHGVILSNTTINPELKSRYGWADEVGGLSGHDEDYRRRSIERVTYAYDNFGDRLVIVGVGGINSWQNALRYILAGATTVQFLTGLRQKGLSLPGDVNRGISNWLDKVGLDSIQEAVGRRDLLPTLSSY